MRACIVMLISILGLNTVSPATPAASKFQYLSPVPGSSMVSPKTTIILRPWGQVERASLSAESKIKAIGSSSGKHDGKLILSDDSRTLVFKPQSSFKPGETVTVKIEPGFPGLLDIDADSLSFTFTIATETMLQRPGLIQNDSLRGVFPGTPFSERTSSRGKWADFGHGPIASSLPQISVSVSDHPTPGYIYLSNFVFDPSIPFVPYLMIVDNSGVPVFSRQMPDRCLDFKIQPNGMLTYYDQSLLCYVGLDSSATVVDSFMCGNGYSTDLHELRILSNGHALLFSYDSLHIPMNTVIAGGDPNAVVIGLIVQELDRAKNVVFQWRSWDNFGITDATHEDLTAPIVDYVHGNSIEYDNDGNIIISCRHMDEITKIDRQTGSVLWRLGGKNNQFRFINDSIGFSHQHAVRRIANGHITMFDNGNFHDPQFSRAVEYAVDELHKTATLVWQYRNTPDLLGGAMGYVQRLDNGNTFICWGATNPTVTEVRPDGSKAFEMTLPEGQFSYRAYRFHWGPLALSVAPTTGGPGSYVLSQNYPNPFNPATTIEFQIQNQGHVSVKVFDILGREVRTLVNGVLAPGVYRQSFDARGLSSGVYFYRLEANGYSETRRMALTR